MFVVEIFTGYVAIVVKNYQFARLSNRILIQFCTQGAIARKLVSQAGICFASSLQIVGIARE
jgi:chorismate synthase